MNFSEKSRIINQYLDKTYNQLIKECSQSNDYDSIKTKFGLEYSKLSNYVIAIKNELIDEIMSSPWYHQLNEENKRKLIESIETQSLKLQIPRLAPMEEDISDSVSVTYNTNKPNAKTVKRSTSGKIGAGTGAVLGAGLGLALNKGVGIVFLSSLTLAALGSVIGISLGGRKPSRQEVDKGIAEKHSFIRLNKDKIRNILENRQEKSKETFMKYLQQLEEICKEYM